MLTTASELNVYSTPISNPLSTLSPLSSTIATEIECDLEKELGNVSIVLKS